MQTQSDVSVFSGVGRRLLNINMVKRHLLSTLARHLFKGNDTLAQILQRQAGHVVSTTHRINDVRLEHRVVRYSPQRNAMIRQYVRIVLEVLTYFFNGIRFE